jgi:hypothetical protein
MIMRFIWFASGGILAERRLANVFEATEAG